MKLKIVSKADSLIQSLVSHISHLLSLYWADAEAVIWARVNMHALPQQHLTPLLPAACSPLSHASGADQPTPCSFSSAPLRPACSASAPERGQRHPREAKSPTLGNASDFGEAELPPPAKAHKLTAAHQSGKPHPTPPALTHVVDNATAAAVVEAVGPAADEQQKRKAEVHEKQQKEAIVMAAWESVKAARHTHTQGRGSGDGASQAGQDTQHKLHSRSKAGPEGVSAGSGGALVPSELAGRAVPVVRMHRLSSTPASLSVPSPLSAEARVAMKAVAWQALMDRSMDSVED